jgi:hypothetical protein
MTTIYALAPTIIDAVKAIDQGCRKILNDPIYQPDLEEWLCISNQFCWGCLATSTLMQLTHLNGTAILAQCSSTIDYQKFDLDQRAAIYGIAPNEEGSYADLGYFEIAINRLRLGDLQPLLNLYKLQNHPNYEQAIDWYKKSVIPKLDVSTKKNMMLYGYLLKTNLIPQLEIWFK